MLTVGQTKVRNCRGVSRRDFLQVGGVSVLGLSLAQTDQQRALAKDAGKQGDRDTACIMLWLDGGPSHLETFDPKPDAPEAIRGPYGATQTSTPGVFFSELLPLSAQWMDRLSVIRSLNHTSGGHSAIPMLSGLPGETTSYGAVVSKFKGFSGNMPPYIHLGSGLAVGGGRMGLAFEPVKIRDPSGKQEAVPGFTLNPSLTPERLADRLALQRQMNALRKQFEQDGSLEKLDQFHERAFDILTSAKIRQAFDLEQETMRTRDRYGANFFGQSCLMARRLVEAGARFVQIKWYDGPAWDAWDVHGADLGGMTRMERRLCPRFDLGFTGLLEDLARRDMLDSTLVVAVGEFGRTPKVNKFGARDHWPNCFSAVLAGGGVPGGVVVGASDAQGGVPADRPVSPAEFAATLYQLLGINTTTVNRDPRIGPFIGNAAPLGELI